MSKEENKPDVSSPHKGGLFSVVRPYRVIVTVLIFMALAGSSINLVIPRIIANGIDAFSGNRFSVGKVIIEFLLAAAGIFIFTFLQSVVQTLTSERVARDLRRKLSDKLSRQSYSFILNANPSKLLTNLTSDMDLIKMFVSQAFITIISSLFVIIGVAVLLIMINWKLALAVLTIVPIIAIAFFIVFRKVRVLFRRSRDSRDQASQGHCQKDGG